MPKITGIVKVYVDGALLRSKEGAKLVVGGKERTPQVGYKVYGHSEKVVPGSVEFVVAHTADTDLIEMSNYTDATLKFETDTGKSFLITDAFTSKPAELTGGEGDVAMEMMGNPAVAEE